MSLPWDDPNHDVLADLREYKLRRGKSPMPVYTDTPTLSYAEEQLAEAEKKDMRGVVIFSGGLDSTTLVYHLLHREHNLHLLSFDYGQRHKRELEFAAATAKHLELRHDIIDLTNITHLISNSALTSKHEFDTEKCDGNCGDDSPHSHHLNDIKEPIEVPEGHYAKDNMKLTVVPNRNMIMASIAAGVAVNEGAQFIATAVHAGDHFVYPDCRPVFWNALGRAIAHGNEGFSDFKRDYRGAYDEPIDTPFLHWSKADIAYRALELGVPLQTTWSCYKGGEKHCGRCGTCVERLEAIAEADKRFRATHDSNDSHMDHTEYEDNEFWKQQVSNA